MSIHLIFEGAELAGKSWLMSQIYNYIEPKYNQSGFVLDGCHWFNCDNGIFGNKHGRKIISGYLGIFKTLNKENIIVEKLHISDMVNNYLHRNKRLEYSKEETILKKMNFRIVLITFPEDKEIIKNRIKDRLNLYPHYKKILKDEKWYINQQKEYIKNVKRSKLPYLIVETDKLPDEKPVKKIIEWL